MISDPRNEILSMSRILGLTDVDVEQIVSELDCLRIPNRGEKADPETLLWPRHITRRTPNTYTETLSKDDINLLESRYGWWLAQQGYSTASTQSVSRL